MSPPPKFFATSLDNNEATADPSRGDARGEENQALAAREPRDSGTSLRGYAKDLRGSLSDPSDRDRNMAAKKADGRVTSLE